MAGNIPNLLKVIYLLIMILEKPKLGKIQGHSFQDIW